MIWDMSLFQSCRELLIKKCLRFDFKIVVMNGSADASSVASTLSGSAKAKLRKKKARLGPRQRRRGRREQQSPPNKPNGRSRAYQAAKLKKASSSDSVIRRAAKQTKAIQTKSSTSTGVKANAGGSGGGQKRGSRGGAAADKRHAKRRDAAQARRQIAASKENPAAKAAALKVNTSLASARTADELLEIYAEHSGSFATVNISTFWSRLGKLRPLERAVLHPSRHRLTQALRVQTIASLNESKKVGKNLYSLGAQSWSTQGLANVAHAHGILAYRGDEWSELMDVLAQAMQPVLHKFEPQALGNTVWAYAKAGHASPDLFEAVAQAALYFAGRTPSGSTMLKRRLKAFEIRIGHQFKDAALLSRAVTHSSMSSSTRSDNQRMEFLGDRVLGLVMSEALYLTDMEAAEGQMTRRLGALVRKETCADVAREIGLGEVLRLGRSELGRSEMISGGRGKLAVLGDAMEAVIAAVYLDAGYDVARDFVLRFWKTRIEGVDDARDPKTALQGWAQARRMDPPKYVETARNGPEHAPVFTIAARLDSGVEAIATAGSKRQAEQAAAKALLSELENSK